MAKSSLSNSLLGKRITPKPEYGSIPAEPSGLDVNAKMWAGMKTNAVGQLSAEIVAAYTKDSVVVVVAVDPFGNVGEFYIKNVNIVMEVI